MTTHYEPHHVSDLVAENVRSLMARTRTKQNDLGDALGLTQGAISKKLNGGRPFTLDEIEDVAAYFSVPVTALFEPPNVVPFRGGLADDTQARHTTGQHGPIRHITGLRAVA